MFAIQFDQWIATTAPLLVAIGGATWKLWQQRNREHKQNRELLEAILYDQMYLVPHDHIEARLPGSDKVALTSGGIIRRPNGLPPPLKRGGTP